MSPVLFRFPLSSVRRCVVTPSLPRCCYRYHFTAARIFSRTAPHLLLASMLAAINCPNWSRLGQRRRLAASAPIKCAGAFPGAIAALLSAPTVCAYNNQRQRNRLITSRRQNPVGLKGLLD